MQNQSKPVEVMPYNPEWKTAFCRIKEMLEGYVGDLCIAIEHVGSTSVEGLSAKPVIDVDVVITGYEQLPLIVMKLSEAGYEHEGNLGVEGREAFKRTRNDEYMSHHLYVCPVDGKGYQEHIAFRDYLRCNAEALRAYEDLKLDLAQQYKFDRDGYGRNKTDFISNILNHLSQSQNRRDD